jgi:hypothetical protein
MYKQVPTFRAMSEYLKLVLSLHTLQLTLEVPVERDNTHEEAKERKCGKEPIGGWTHCGFREPKSNDWEI